jgi:hypothetical protein
VNNDTLEQVSFGLDLVNLARNLDNSSPDFPDAADVDQIGDALRASGLHRKAER